jgi:hypothetical protein
VIERKGVFCALYSDRGSPFWLTPYAQGKADQFTQVGRAGGSRGTNDPGVLASGARQIGAQSRHRARGIAPVESRLRRIRIVEERKNRFLRED